MNTLSARALALLVDGWRGAGSAPAYLALADRIRLLILDGRIGLGARVPAERDLSAQLGVSRTTVSAAYARLRDAGYLSSVRGSGSVARLPSGTESLPDSAAFGFVDFSKASMPALPAVAAAAQRAAEQLPAYLGGSGFDPVGIPVLRQAIADRYTARGLPTEADQIMVTLGAQHAIALIARTLLARGDHALVESPSYPHAFEALRAAGARLVPVAVSTDDGWDEQGFEQAIKRTSPSLGYLMPDFHNPTGMSMSAEFRERALELASRTGTTLIADETMAELGLDGPDGPGALRALDLPERAAGLSGSGGTGAPERSLPFAAFARAPGAASSAILVGSVGKTIWGGLRIGWIRADRSVIHRLTRARAAGDLGTPILDQLLVTDLLGDYDAILAERRTYLRIGRDRLVRLLGERIPEWTVPHVPGGLTAWVGLGAPVSSQLTLAARNHGLHIAAGPLFGPEGAFDRFLRIPFSYSEEETVRGVDALAAAWESVGRYPMPEHSYLAEVV
ncbi:GntR family transcriptional regulator [Glaciihabitans tibetensis]|uniref:GntR family transcriptional regulator n=1 Tax=Glaciihabitans tibetensis TaxID=1266600 RepID=A0A2T0VDC1_9MICO|nr:PLP-dependent aminotransferase family protein [Glaciihabitans tibetensis]PRY68162.1 GntR family transcriptional regulator [Glaciihabitans tibetensis]